MSDNKDELLKQQNEEIQKLKKELKAATKPVFHAFRIKKRGQEKCTRFFHS